MEERTDFLNIRAGHISFWKWVKDVMRTDVFLFWNLRDIRPYLRIPYFIKKYFVVKKQTKCEK